MRLNPRAPFLSSRNISLTYHPNGTLKTINAEGIGSGGAVLASLIKTGAGFLALGPVGTLVGSAVQPAPLVAGEEAVPRPPRRRTVACRPEVAAKVARWQRLAELIAEIETAAAGAPGADVRLAAYGRYREEQTILEDDLTLSTSVRIKRDREAVAAARRAGQDGLRESFALGRIDYLKWFRVDGAHRLPKINEGAEGFCARISANALVLDASHPVKLKDARRWRASSVGSDGQLVDGRVQDRFVYLRPVPVDVELRERSAAGADCTATFDKGAAAGRGTVAVPQLSGHFILPLGAGAFGSRGTSAELTIKGAILSIGTKSAGSGGGVAEALAGALTGAQTLRDARTEAIERRVERIKAQNKLNKLLEPTPTSLVVTG